MFDCNSTVEDLKLWECKAIDANFIIDCAFGGTLILLFGVTIYRALKRKSLNLLALMSGILAVSVASIMVFTIFMYTDTRMQEGERPHIYFRNYFL
jgi:hypothetical protein